MDILVNDGDELPILGGVKIVHTPGHTLGSICLFLQQERLVIAGDLLAHTFRLSLPSKEFTVDISQEVHLVKRLASLDFDIICFGHGAPLMYNARPAIINFVKVLANTYPEVH